VEDEWLATIAAYASIDWYHDRKKPRVRPKDRKCNQPKARQGWNKKAMCEVRVRMCVGCDRMLPAHALIRIARLRKDAGVKAAAAATAVGGSARDENESGADGGGTAGATSGVNSPTP
jgi:hypothetical protein